jgi:hypothetical protein
VPPIRPIPHHLSATVAGCLQAARISRKVSNTRRGTRYRVMKVLDMNPIVIGGAFRVDSS